METVLSDRPVSDVSPGSPCSEATYYAPAGRDTPEELRRKMAVIEGTPFLGQTLNAIPSMVMILNVNRQIVAANNTLLTLLDAAIGQVVQKRPGEAVGCIRAKEGPDECGTSRHCVTCGAVNAILESQATDRQVVRECRILVQTPSGIAPLDLRVTASSFRVADDRFLVVVVEDISQSKRLAVLQRTFFHDVLNTAGCVLGYAQYLHEDEVSDREVCGRLVHLSDQLIESIQAQRDLVYAESGDLRIQPVPIRASQLLDELRFQYGKHPAAAARTIELSTVWDGTVTTDRQLLKRVLGNMVKNALEATGLGGKVTLSLHDHGGEAAFAVHNTEVMPEKVQLQVFQRSFSTKGQTGRGIGTYSMKLFGERYLGGKVRFTSRPGKGTTFTLTIPKNPPHGRP